MRLVNLLLGCVLAFAVTTSAAAAGRIGVVILHGKWGSPNGHTHGLATHLEHEGFLVQSPEMPWSGNRDYDAGMDTAMAEIDSAVSALRNAGARRIVIVGHSMGANAALHYAGRTKVDGVVVISLGQYPAGSKARGWFGASVAKARHMVGAGHGDDQAWFKDFNTGRGFRKERCSAKTYLSYFAPDGPMNAGKNAAGVKPGTPVLWIVGAEEPAGLRRLNGMARDKLTPDPADKFLKVDAGHLGTPDASKRAIADWLRSLKED